MRKSSTIIKYICFSLLVVLTPHLAFAVDNKIDSDHKYAWGDTMGWINFAPVSGGVYYGLNVTSSSITGYAWSTQGGWINFSPGGNNVSLDSSGNLSGYAWSSNKGWINMAGVNIDSSGKFSGVAGSSGTAAGRITFSCSTCDVVTTMIREDPVIVKQVGQVSGSMPLKKDEIESNVSTTTPANRDFVDKIDKSDKKNTNPKKGNESIDQKDEFESPYTLIENGGLNNIPPPNITINRENKILNIEMFVDSNEVKTSNDLVARVKFTNKSEPVLVDLKFNILDSSGKEVYSGQSLVKAKKENTFTKRFTETYLDPGRYSLKLVASYSANDREEFSQPFIVMQAKVADSYPIPFGYIVVFVMMLIPILLFIKSKLK